MVSVSYIHTLVTTPPARLPPTHLPLHRGGKTRVTTMLFYFGAKQDATNGRVKTRPYKGAIALI